MKTWHGFGSNFNSCFDLKPQTSFTLNIVVIISILFRLTFSLDASLFAVFCRFEVIFVSITSAKIEILTLSCRLVVVVSQDPVTTRTFIFWQRTNVCKQQYFNGETWLFPHPLLSETRIRFRLMLSSMSASAAAVTK